VTINVSSPNTKGLRDLQERASSRCSGALPPSATRSPKHGRRVPLAVKIAPDLDDGAGAIAQLLVRHRIDGVIATNTTLTHATVSTAFRMRPKRADCRCALRERSTAVLKVLATTSTVRCRSSASAESYRPPTRRRRSTRRNARAALHGLIYRGPDPVAECALRPRGNVTHRRTRRKRASLPT
jgi:dihydroorotate dehydrogenase